MSNFKNSWPVFLGFIAIGVIVGVVLTSGLDIDSKSYADKSGHEKIYAEPSAPEEVTQEPVTIGNFNPNAVFVEVVKKVKPSIVTIYTTKNVKIPDNPWHRFFREWGFETPQNQEPQEYQQGGLGSGIIISKDGYILTNHHVVKDVDELRIKLVDDREFKAEIIGTDPMTEIALVKIDAKNLSPAVLGNSENLQIGEWVLAIGSPLELNFTVTAGIVSALSRDINIIRDNPGYQIENFIQTDAAINPGNSGGALVNYKGEVIGVNTAIASSTGSYIGYGFAVPINLAKKVVDDFIEFGEVRRGYIGVSIRPVTPVIAKGVGLDKPRGVFIENVIDDKPADRAGIKSGDIILSVEGSEVNRPNQLQAKVGSYKPGDNIRLQVWRDGREMTFNVILESLDSQGGETAKQPGLASTDNLEALGISVADLNDELRSSLDVDNGVVVRNVKRNSPAYKEGLGTNDIIYEIDGKAIESVSQFNEYLSSLSKGDIIKIQVLRVDREGGTYDRLVFLQIPE
jgi:serine protease Do